MFKNNVLDDGTYNVKANNQKTTEAQANKINLTAVNADTTIQLGVRTAAVTPKSFHDNAKISWAAGTKAANGQAFVKQDAYNFADDSGIDMPVGAVLNIVAENKAGDKKYEIAKVVTNLAAGVTDTGWALSTYDTNKFADYKYSDKQAAETEIEFDGFTVKEDVTLTLTQTPYDLKLAKTAMVDWTAAADVIDSVEFTGTNGLVVLTNGDNVYIKDNQEVVTLTATLKKAVAAKKKLTGTVTVGTGITDKDGTNYTASENKIEAAASQTSFTIVFKTTGAETAIITIPALELVDAAG